MKISNYQDTASLPSQASTTAKTKQAEKESGGINGITSMEDNQNQINRKLMESVYTGSVGNSSGALELAFKTVMDRISEAVDGDSTSTDDSSSETSSTTGTSATNPYQTSQQDDYWSPENTAKRIVSFGTSFFESYMKNHPEKDLDTALTDFVDLIGGGIDKGFSDAKDVLDKMGKLEGDVSSNIDSTYDLVQKGLQDFIDSYSKDSDSGDTSSSDD
ncbi:DUF5610 domain-containing protein [Pokkaliibacter sp. CJK22405]|uniref:DUF5610 domain-containing protein n=1 Tax=Pokkaliibacter sp. CJK22405 TaxID=3384615 RepID=UPI0039852BFC